MSLEIEIKQPDGQVERVRLERKRTIVGRSTSADIRIADDRVSREHCALEVDGGQIYVVDLGGSNGTWIGKSKLLANVREPFPEDATVYIGPAELRRPRAASFGGGADQLESQVYQPVAPQRPAARDGGRGAPPARPEEPSEAVLVLSQPRVKAGPGERTGLQVIVSNQGRNVDHYQLRISGVPSTWVTLPRGQLNLMPREEGNMNLDFHPPRDTRTSAGAHQVNIALVNQAGKVVARADLELEVAAFDNLALDIRPNPYQSRMGGRLNLTVENKGNARTEYSVHVIEASDAVEISVEPPKGQLAPQQEREHLIRLRPRKRIWLGEAKRMPLTVTVSSDRTSADVMPTYTQLATIPRWIPIILGLLCCVLLPIFGFLGFQIYQQTKPTATPTPTITPTPVTPTPSPTTDLSGTATTEWLAGDDDFDGLTNAEELELGTDPRSKDTDGDNLDDRSEVKQYSTDPLNRDSDGDNLLDGAEVGTCTSPRNPDTDGDGIPDQTDPDPCEEPTPTVTPETLPTPVPNFAYGGQIRGFDPDPFGPMGEARMEWVKKQVPFSPGANAASTAEDLLTIKDEGFKLLITIKGNREDIASGRGYYQQLAAFAAELSLVVDAIEVWNEPNLDREWPTGQINPAEYTELLRVVYQAVKARNPRVLVISGAPSPTGFNDGGQTAMSDDRFINGMAAAGARNYMDCVGTHFNAGATPPNETTGHPADNGQGHYSWYFPKLLDLYWNAFNGAGQMPPRPLCITEIGFVTPDGFRGQTLPGGFSWGESITEFDQAIWLADALQRSCLSGKVKMFIVWNINFVGATLDQDPQSGYAIIRPDDSCPACSQLAQAVSSLRTQRCMG